MKRLVHTLLATSLLAPLSVAAQAGNSSAGRAPAGRASAGGALSNDDISRLGPEAQVFFSTLDVIRDYALEPRADSLLWEEAIDGLVKELNDPYATVLSPDEVASFEEQSTGNYAGIGIGIEVLNGAVTITKVFPNTPADHGGIMVGDLIVGVDDDTGASWTTDDAATKIRGEVGTKVVVHIDREGFSEPRPFELERAEVHAPAVQGEHISGDLQYLLLERVTRNSAAEVDSVLNEMGDVHGLIFDLRQNPGGYLDESLNLADLFLDRGSVLVTTRSRARGTDELREESARARMTPRMNDNIPIVVLVDRYSASAAEIIAGALQDHDRALVLGERSFGKGTVQSVIPLPGGRLIRITSGQWFTPQGRMINRPRDAQGRPIAQADSVPEYKSVAGRTLIGGGGIFPDLQVLDDTLTATEQDFMQATVDAEYPLQTNIQETALTAVQEARDAGDPESAPLPEDAMDGLYASILDAGVPEGKLTEETRDYLRWRVEVVYYQRLGREDRALEVRSERDTVLGTAIRFLHESQTQNDLFALAEAESEARAEAHVRPSTPSAGASQPN